MTYPGRSLMFFRNYRPSGRVKSAASATQKPQRYELTSIPWICKSIGGEGRKQSGCLFGCGVCFGIISYSDARCSSCRCAARGVARWWLG